MNAKTVKWAENGNTNNSLRKLAIRRDRREERHENEEKANSERSRSEDAFLSETESGRRNDFSWELLNVSLSVSYAATSKHWKLSRRSSQFTFLHFFINSNYNQIFSNLYLITCSNLSVNFQNKQSVIIDFFFVIKYFLSFECLEGESSRSINRCLLCINFVP